MTGIEPPSDPVVARRRRVGRLADRAQRAGYLLFLAAIVVFLVGLFTEFSPFVATTVIACLAVGSVLLAPAIVLGYAVKAADRDDRERGLG